VLHEVLRELFAKRPDLIAPLLDQRLDLPAKDLIAIDSELTDPHCRRQPTATSAIRPGSNRFVGSAFSSSSRTR
jgi:hypothetical protein